MTIVARLHDRRVHPRRVRVLRDHLAELLPQNARVPDVGCRDGLLAHLIMEARPDVEISGIDVLVRPQTSIPVRPFDGRVTLNGAASFDVVMLVEVPHHLDEPIALLREAVRVAGAAVLIKDLTRDGFLAGPPTLQLMDRVGNAHHGVALPIRIGHENTSTERSTISISMSPCGKTGWDSTPVSSASRSSAPFISSPGSTSGGANMAQ